MEQFRVPNRPCPKSPKSKGCPWVKTTEPGEFSRERYEELRVTSIRPDGTGQDMGDPMFACHNSKDGEEYVCAGWLATQGHRHPGVRLNVMLGAFPACALEPGPDWPELFDDYEEMKAAREGD